MSQIDRQIEENVAVSSMENLQLSCSGLVHSENLVDDYRVVENGIPDLSIISEENSHIPTDLCTSVSVPFFTGLLFITKKLNILVRFVSF